MAFRIERFPDTPEAKAAARRFNERLHAGGETEFDLMESPFSRHRPEGPDSPMWQQYFLAIEEEREKPVEVRGGYLLQYQGYGRNGETTAAPHAFLRLPLSEGVVNKQYAAVGMLLLRDAMKRESNLCSLGMGGIHRPLPRLMAAMGWHVAEVPFSFLVLHPLAFLRQARVLRNKRFMAPLCDMAAWSGLGWLGLKALQFRLPAAPAPGITVTCEAEFGPWADAVWESSAPHYSFYGERNQKLLNTLYSPDDPRWIRCVVRRDGQPAGWCLLLCTQTNNHKQFGSMRLGSIADCLSAPADAALVVRAAVAELRRRGADVVVTNQLHQDWNTALKKSGFLSGPSNFVWALSPSLKKQLEPLDTALPRAHINRGDGDGPINL
ncbi:MAG: hypothetical protein JWO94_1341 [Verrucomicrobiaceae bacterium]|nr:hypothetical protein [Verrucomicrobiaceae bacterium]